MVDYTFYVKDYLGSVIPENAFSGMAAQAQQCLERFKRIYRVESTGKNAEALAVCAMAESIWAWRNRGVSSASVGNVSVHYDKAKTSLQRELYEKATIYLDIFRGVDG